MASDRKSDLRKIWKKPKLIGQHNGQHHSEISLNIVGTALQKMGSLESMGHCDKDKHSTEFDMSASFVSN